MKDFKIVVPTCNKYSHLLKGISYCFNKFWTSNHDVDVLYFDNIPNDLPVNFKLKHIGSQNNEKSWSDTISNYLKSIKENYFLMILDDYFLTGPIKIGILERLCEYND